MRWIDFFDLVLEDFKHHGGNSLFEKIKVFFLDPSFQLLFNARFAVLLNSSKIPIIPSMSMTLFCPFACPSDVLFPLPCCHADLGLDTPVLVERTPFDLLRQSSATLAKHQ